MDEWSRGQIQYPKRASQLIDFRGLCYDNITPTDIDGLIEFKDKLYVFLELKLRGVDIKLGQQLCFERLCNDLSVAGKVAIAIIAEHNTPVDQQIPCADAKVRKCYKDGDWVTPDNPITVGELVDIYYRKHIGEIRNLKRYSDNL